ncbi:hypothetical protein CAP35_00240 [Chitinophagaceae bacterium IBVUCB1]|nr:hypothetical protein CAP35_00240 [Chitinophagaceae bacterium IBVUCB1]
MLQTAICFQIIMEAFFMEISILPVSNGDAVCANNWWVLSSGAITNNYSSKILFIRSMGFDD